MCPQSTIAMIYKSLVLPHFIAALTVWACIKIDLRLLDEVHTVAMVVQAFQSHQDLS